MLLKYDLFDLLLIPGSLVDRMVCILYSMALYVPVWGPTVQLEYGLMGVGGGGGWSTITDVDDTVVHNWSYL